MQFDLLSSGWRRRSDGGWYRAGDSAPLDWHELFVLVKGWVGDTRFHLARAVSPDWEWERTDNWFASHILLALHGANWQRGGGKGERPKRVTPLMLRGEDDDSAVSKSGVRSGRRRGRVVAVASAADLGSVKDRMAARRRARRRVAT